LQKLGCELAACERGKFVEEAAGLAKWLICLSSRWQAYLVTTVDQEANVVPTLEGKVVLAYELSLLNP